ncbi:hypothetical protein HDK77DRAFT_205594 [Phyllosticta capitalensis]|uniref:Transcription elongation factor 1 homolog n=1 Tax=Phyllosticta capitalensis TaxID=121624 RepID=A0ABR1Z2S0_9PEZI
MGKRKKSSRGPVAPKKREGLATVFQCLFCNHEKSVTIQMDKKGNIGNLQCKVCGVNFQQPITSISQPIDVYYEWVDACDAVAQEEKDDRADLALQNKRYREIDTMTSRDRTAATRTRDDFIDDDEADGEADYADDD